MSRVIHDWDNYKVLEILRNAYNSLEDNGHLLIFETIVPEPLNKDIGLILNFNLLVCVGGKERTLKEFQDLLEKAKFKIFKIKRGKSIISLIIAKKRH